MSETVLTSRSKKEWLTLVTKQPLRLINTQHWSLPNEVLCRKFQLGSKIAKGITAKRWTVKRGAVKDPRIPKLRREWHYSVIIYLLLLSEHKLLWRKNGHHYIVPKIETKMYLQSILNGGGFAQKKALGCITKVTEPSWVDKRKLSEGDIINAILEWKLSLPFWKGTYEAIFKCYPLYNNLSFPQRLHGIDPQFKNSQILLNQLHFTLKNKRTLYVCCRENHHWLQNCQK